MYIVVFIRSATILNEARPMSTTTNSAGKLVVSFFFFSENWLLHFLQLVSIFDILYNLHEMLAFFFSGKKENISKCCLMKFLPSTPER